MDEQPPQKRMRKGTKSCFECRRRKIRCTYEPGRPTLCSECAARGSACVEQEEYSEPQSHYNDRKQSYSLRERVTYLEAITKDVLRRLGDAAGSREVGGGNVTKSSNGLFTGVGHKPQNSLDTALHGSAPILSLFDNAVLERKEDAGVEDSGPGGSIFSNAKDAQIRKELSLLLPSQNDVQAIFHSSQFSRKAWRWVFPESYTSPEATTEQLTAKAYGARNPVIVAKILLCVAISLEQLPTGFGKRYLSLLLPANQLIEKYVSTVSRLITSDDDIADTIEGIECMLLETKHYLNVGRPRKAWHIYRRAISFAEQIGIHRVLPAASGQTNEISQRQYHLWCSLVEGERYISLILGLPYSVGDSLIISHIPKSIEETSLLPSEFYSLNLALMSSHIIDRNQDPAKMSLSTTLLLDEELREIKDSMPPDTWNVDMNPQEDKAGYFDRLIAQFFHHQIRTLIHLPLMLKSGFDQRYIYSKAAAIESSRAMVVCYKALRSESPVGPFVCKVVDFQAFTAAMLLLLNHLGYARKSPDKTSEGEGKDWGLIKETIELLHQASSEPGGIIAAQSARALETIALFRHSCDRYDGLAATKTARISIPYFGTISIGVGKNFTSPQPPRDLQSAKQGMAQPEHNYSSATPNAFVTSPFGLCPTQSTCSTICSASPNTDSSTSTVFGTEDPLISFDSLWAKPPPIPGHGYGASATSSYSVQGPVIMDSIWLNETVGGERIELDQGWNWVGFGNEA